MKTIVPSKKNQMKKKDLMITAGFSWRYLRTVLVALLVGGFFLDGTIVFIHACTY